MEKINKNKIKQNKTKHCLEGVVLATCKCQYTKLNFYSHALQGTYL